MTQALCSALDATPSSPRDDNEGGFSLDPQATKAFVAGNKALAKELGVKGREQSELMKAAHAEASKAIYKHRNPVSGGTLPSGDLSLQTRVMCGHLSESSLGSDGTGVYTVMA